MIQSFRSKALKIAYEKDNYSKITATHRNKVRALLTLLDAAESIDDVNLPGTHQLQGTLDGFHSSPVSGNWRVTYRFEDGHAHDIDYLDYH